MTDTLVQQRALFFVKSTRTPRLRTYREFFEQEIIIPTGDFAGMRWRADRQPCWALFLDELDKAPERGWNEANVTGTTQSGKSLHSFAGLVVYDVCELGESVAVGVPNEKMIASKWQRDIRPLIAASRYKHLLPKRGAGSQGGMPEMIRFQNGAVLRFFTGGGSDKTVAGETYKIIRVTETDGMDTAGESSREANRVDQLKARAMSYGDNYLWSQECTLSTEQGRTWQDHTKSTASRIVCPCPECNEWVTPLREHFSFDKDAPDVIAARESGQWCCPSCGYAISEDERASMNRAAKLMHRTEEDGSPVRTLMFSFRMTAFNNLFVGAARIAQQEWEAVHAENPDDAEKKLCQFVHCMPYVPDITDLIPLSARDLERNMVPTLAHGIVPPDMQQFAGGCDVGRYYLDWVSACSREGNRFHIVDYGGFPVMKRGAGKGQTVSNADEDSAILAALRQWRDEVVLTGWDGKVPSQYWVDSGYRTAVVYQFCNESNAMQNQCVFRPVKGAGTVKRYGQGGAYTHPTAKSNIVRHIGDMYHFRRHAKDRIDVVHFNADYWKMWLWRRLAVTDKTAPGALTFYEHKEPHHHRAYSDALVSERLEEEFVKGKGMITRIVVAHKTNTHKLDATCYAVQALHFLGARITTESIAEQRRGKWFQRKGRTT